MEATIKADRIAPIAKMMRDLMKAPGFMTQGGMSATTCDLIAGHLEAEIELSRQASIEQRNDDIERRLRALEARSVGCA